MGKVHHAKYFSKAVDYVLNTYLACSTDIKYFESIEKVEI